MKPNHSEKKLKPTVMLMMLLAVSQVFVYCQDNQKAVQQQEKSKTVTPAQTATVKKILSKYNPKKLTTADAKAIHEQFRAAGLHAGPETRDAIVAAGFDPDKLRDLDPPKSQDNKGSSTHKPNEDRMNTIREKVITPLALNATQNDVVTKAYQDFFTAMEAVKKTQADPRAPVEKSKVEPLEKTRNDKISKALTKDQYSKYLELEKASRPPRNENPAGK
jgi:hypothetical protein